MNSKWTSLHDDQLSLNFFSWHWSDMNTSKSSIVCNQVNVLNNQSWLLITSDAPSTRSALNELMNLKKTFMNQIWTVFDVWKEHAKTTQPRWLDFRLKAATNACFPALVPAKSRDTAGFHQVISNLFYWNWFQHVSNEHMNIYRQWYIWYVDYSILNK